MHFVCVFNWIFIAIRIGKVQETPLQAHASQMLLPIRSQLTFWLYVSKVHNVATTFKYN